MNIKELIALTMVKGIGPAYIKKSMGQLRYQDEIISIVKKEKPEEESMVPQYLAKAEEIINDCDRVGIGIISILSENYPQSLFEISSPPCILYSKGNVDLINNAIAIIGTRHSTSLGNRIAERLGTYFSTKYSICNGLVDGIDKNVVLHDNKSIPNVVGVISGGLNYSETCSLQYAKIIDNVLDAGGLVLSEYAPNQKGDKYSGSQSSRIQAGLSKGLILVQSSVSGGSKYTMSAFSKLNRVVGVINFESSDEYKNDDSFGANRLIAQKGLQGVAEFIGIKSVSSIKLKTVIPINTNNDYSTFEKSME